MDYGMKMTGHCDAKSYAKYNDAKVSFLGRCSMESRWNMKLLNGKLYKN
jgi:hypothetical protein